jgi:phosphoacetylglucosamine mutase
MDHIFFRVGVLAAVRSKVLGGKAVGVMVTASHNPEQDNGVKMVEPMGEMLPIDWEGRAARLANATDAAFKDEIVALCEEVGADLTVRAEVIVGRDTRASSSRLCMAVCDGVSAMSPAFCRSLGLVTTPQLHYTLRCTETNGGYGTPSTVGYSEKLLAAFEKLASQRATSDCARYSPEVTVDCANGVGGVAMASLLQMWDSRPTNELLKPCIANERPSQGRGLNDGCGADFVKVKQTTPGGVDLAPGMRMLSFDGDADRIVYFFDGGDGFRLLDGDRIALLIAYAAAQWLQEAGITSLRLGLVQTAYANGASTACAVASVGEANVLCAKTGVKHVHHAALVMDVGIYFEANGHGTVLFSDKFIAECTKVAAEGGTKGASATRLLMLRDIINEAVGDAISIMLAVEAILRLLDWSCLEWFGMYSDLPQRQIKVVVADRSAIETTNAERTVTKPDGLQAEIDKLVASTPKGRAFVRPSGTEDVVRVYAEAESVKDMLSLAQAVVDVVFAMAGGRGDKPVVS